MKKIFLFLLLAATGSLLAVKVGMRFVYDPQHPEFAYPTQSKGNTSGDFFLAEIARGNLMLHRVQEDTLSGMAHKRYRQYFHGLPVWGGEIIQHLKAGEPSYYDGVYFQVPEMDLTPGITSSYALACLEAVLGEKGLQLKNGLAQLVIFPENENEFPLAYLLSVEKGAPYLFSETALVDAGDGRVLLHFPNIVSEELCIGSGHGQRGDLLKFPTTLISSNHYYLMDQSRVRPVTQFTYNCNHTLNSQIHSSTSNTWPSDNILNIHTYIGLCYDFYYSRFGLQGIDNHNKALLAFGHVFDATLGISDNAMYTEGMFFFLDPWHGTKDYGAAVDVVAHEYSHGVTDYHASLIYYSESGALNESFSDIMGTAVEFTFQPEGIGYSKADWYCSEDANPAFSYERCRSQSDPNSNSQLQGSSWSYPDPCHISQKIPTLYKNGLAVDNDGVHLNCTIFPHAYYLLAKGGTNKVSGLTVTGIGIDKATRIFYNAWVNHMVSTDDFLAAADKLIQSAAEIYGSTSNEFNQIRQAMRAIGYVDL